jgi:glycosyltransferase involved in cell wall biosynthesis
VSGRIRLAILDDGQFVRLPTGSVHPQSATFHRFVEAVVRSGPFERARYVVPVRDVAAGHRAPSLGPVDEDILQIVPTAPFAGIADYTIRAGPLSARNWPVIRRTVANSDLLWIRLPASNALLALTACRLAGVPHFGWLAGRVTRVVAGQQRHPPLSWAARLVAAGYDAVSDLARSSAPLVELDDEMFTSIVTRREVADGAELAPVRSQGPWRIVWAGRMASEKGLPDLFRAIELLLESHIDVQLALVGDGPLRPSVERLAQRLPPGTATFHGYVGDRTRYLALLRDGDVFVSPSHAEGLPKVLVEAMASGLPVVATAVGAVPALLHGGELGRPVRARDPLALAAAVRELLGDHRARGELRRRGLDYARAHTAEAQAERLVRWLESRFPQLDWDGHL